MRPCWAITGQLPFMILDLLTGDDQVIPTIQVCHLVTRSLKIFSIK